MANFKLSDDTMQALSEQDIVVLESVYAHRCLDERLAHQYIYASTAKRQGFSHDRLMELVRLRLLEPVAYGKEHPALFLSTLGIEALRHLSESKGQAPVGGDLKTAYELKMKPQSINHQMSLNAFAMEFEHRIKGKARYQYLDAKFMPHCSDTMAPDGMLVLSDRLILLEQDMGSERASHLSLKWNNYRSFLSNPGEFYRDKQITMLFILDGVRVVTKRRATVCSTLYKMLLDRIDGRFEVFADTPQALQEVLTQMLNTHICPEEKTRAMGALRALHGLSVSEAAFSPYLNMAYDGYVRKLNPQRKVAVQNGRAQEFLLDFWMDGRLSVLHKIAYHSRYSLQFSSKMRRGIAYLVIVPDEKWLGGVIRQNAIRSAKDVFFTTVERLEKKALPEALFQIDEAGCLYHFDSFSLGVPVFERRLM